MAITISFTADASPVSQAAAQVSANLSSAFSGIQDQLKAMESASGQATSKMITGLQGLSQATIRLTAPQQDLSKVMLQTGKAAETQLNQFQRLQQQYLAMARATEAPARATQALAQDMQRSLKSVEQAQKSTVDGFTLMQGAIRRTVALLATIGVSVGVAGLAKDMVEVASTFETLDVRLRFLTHSVEEFNKARQFILEFAQTTPLQLDEVSDAFIRLTSSGLDATKMLPILVDAVSAFGGGNESLQSLIRNFQQMSTQAKVSGEELRDIARGSLIPALQIVTEEARKMGISVKDSLAEAGISGPQAIELFLKGAQERFKGATLIMASTWTVLVSNLGDQWKIFSDTVIRESGFLNFMKAAAFELFTLMNTLIKGNKAEFVSWGDAGIAAIRKLSLSVASLADLLNGILSLGARVQAQFAAWERQGSEVMANLYNSVAQFFGFTGNFTAQVQADVAQATGVAVAAITSGEITKAVDQTFDRLQSRAEEFRKTQEGIVGKTPTFARPTPTADTAGADRAAAERAKGEVKRLEETLKREEFLIQQSFDERRQLADQAASEAITADIRNVEVIAAHRTQAMKRLALEEAQALKTSRLASLEETTRAETVAAQAAITAAGGKVKALAAAQEQLTNVQVTAATERAKIEKQYTDIEQQTSKKTADERIKQAIDVNRTIKETEEGRLKSRIDLVDEQIALVQAQADGEVLTTQQGLEKIQALQAQRFADTRLMYEQEAQTAIDAVDVMVQRTVEGTEERVQAEAFAVAQIQKIREGLTSQIQAVHLQQQTQQQEHLNTLTQGWRDWVKDVRGALGDFLFRWMDGQITSIKDVLNDLKSYFFRVIADMAAKAATTQIIIPIVTAVVGGGGGGLGQTIGGVLGVAGAAGGMGGVGGGGGLLETGGMALSGIGLARQLYNYLGIDTLTGYISGGFESLSQTFIGGIDTLFGTSMSAANQAAAEAIELAVTGGQAPGGGAAAVAGSQAGAIAGIAGGLAALGTGIYAALNAANTASRAAFAASAAAGAVAAASAAAGAGLFGAAAATGALTGWTGIGLIVAAVMAVVGVVLDKVIKPAGPSLSVRAGTGLNIGTADGQLQVEGGVGSRTTRRAGVDRALADQVAQQLDAGITNAVLSIVQTINAVALDPAALAAPTQKALQTALRNLQPINTANAKKMEQDIAEQLRFANIAIVGGMLEPLNLAFDQLREMGTVEEQLQRLPATTAGLVEIFKKLNQELSDLGGVQNTDVLRQLSGVKGQVENFGNRIAGTAAQIAESIVNEMVTSMQATVVPTLAGQIRQFAGLMDDSFQALAVLRSTQQTLEGAGLQGGGVGTQIDRLTKTMSEQAERISTEIVTGALANLASELDQILVQPMAIQATTVNSLFTDSMAALQTLWREWHRLEDAGIDAGKTREQFERLLGGILDTTTKVLDQAFHQGSFAEFLGVLASVPDAVAALNPAFAALKQLGAAFAQVVGPIQQVIDTVSADLRTPAEQVAVMAQRMNELESAIADAGDAADKALPLYAQLSAAIQANAAAQIEAAHAQAEAMVTETNQFFQGIIDAINQAAEDQLTVVKDTVEQATAFVNTWADDWTTAIDHATEQATESINTWADDWQAAIRDGAEAATESINAWADDWLTAIRDATEQATEAIRAWGETNIKMVNEWTDAAQTRASQVARLDRDILQELSPAQQRVELTAQRERLRERIATGGPGAETALNELIGINEQLLALAKQSDDLRLQKDVTDEMKRTRDSLRKSMIEMTGTADPILAQIAIANQQKILLEHIEKTVDTELKRIATWQETQTARITDAQTQELARIAVWQETESARIADAQTQELARIAVWQETQRATVTAIQTAELTRLAEWEQSETERITTDQTNAVTAWQAAQAVKLEEIRAWEEETVRAIRVDLVAQLEAVNKRLQELFAGQAAVKVIITNPGAPAAASGGIVSHQQGGVISHLASMNYARTAPLSLNTFAHGGMVSVALEPGERVMYGPFTHAQQGALAAVNDAFPRFAGGGFTVPGSGSGDTFKTRVPSESFVFNRNASRALGFQSGGQVPRQGHSSDGMPSITIDLRGSTFGSAADAHKVRDILEKDVIRIMEEYRRKTRVDTRLG